MVRSEDPSKCRCEQRPCAQVPYTECEPWKLISANFQIPPSIAFQTLVRFLCLQMLPKKLKDTLACGPQGCSFPEMDMPLGVPSTTFLWGCVLMSWTGLLPLFGWVLPSTTPTSMTTATIKCYGRCIASCVASSVCSKAYEKPSDIYSPQAQDPASQINCDHRVHELLWVTLGESHICLKWEMSGFKCFLRQLWWPDCQFNSPLLAWSVVCMSISASKQKIFEFPI